MIGEIIKNGEKGSGAAADAFRPGVNYVCEKASNIEMRNITSDDWRDAADEILFTTELNSRVEKPYYHLVLSWHEHEQPTDDQMFNAADHMIKSLGLDEHQIVIGSHHDTERKHIHLICNTVHPITGKVWSKSHDHMRIEEACRQIEIKQGWSHDRGRFDFEVGADGAVKLLPNDEAWGKKKADRETGIRPKTSGARKFEKRTGIETFEHNIPPELKQRFGEAVGKAFDWQSLHTALGELGLRYYKAGSGARVGILGSEEFTKASAFGSKFSIARLEKEFGPYKEPEESNKNHLKYNHKEIGSVSESVSQKERKELNSSGFKLTLLRRVYCDLHLDPVVSRAIRFVDLNDTPPQITFKDNSTVVDYGSKISVSKNTPQTRAAIIAMAKAKKWTGVVPSGSPQFMRDIALEAAEAGLKVSGVPAEVQAQCDAILERQEKAQRRIELEAQAAEKAALDAISKRDAAVSKNNADRAAMAKHEYEMTAQAGAVLDALGSGCDPVRTAPRTVASGEEKRIKSTLPDRRIAPNPQPAPDADRASDGGKTRRIKAQFRENDAHELDRMREVHIDQIAAIGGWSYAPNHPDGHNDKQNLRTYTRGSDTIKATRKGAVWVWTSNKSGDSGSVIDLWRADNPQKNLGDARQAFREIMGTSQAPALLASARVKDEPADHTQARQRWEQAPYVEKQGTYAEDRGISKATLRRFSDSVRGGVFGGIYFAHRNLKNGDIQGFEQRWEINGKPNHARFAKGGLKSVCVLGNPKTATRLVVFEGGLDALALAEIENRNDTLYVSTGGGFGPRTVSALMTLAQSRAVFSGFDNDEGGNALHNRLIGSLPHTERLSPPSSVQGAKAVCKDWLDVLNARNAAAARPRQVIKPPRAAEIISSEMEHTTQPKDEFSTPEFG